MAWPPRRDILLSSLLRCVSSVSSTEAVMWSSMDCMRSLMLAERSREVGGEGGGGSGLQGTQDRDTVYGTLCAVLCTHVCDCHSHGHFGLAIFAEFELLQVHLKQQSGPCRDSVLDPLQSGMRHTELCVVQRQSTV